MECESDNICFVVILFFRVSVEKLENRSNANCMGAMNSLHVSLTGKEALR